MAKNSITDYSKTASLNTDIQSVDIDEGCLPSGINNAIRELMADLAAMNDGTVSLTSPAFTSVDINGGTIDGVTIGGASAAAGTFTTLTASGDLTVDTSTLKVDSTNNRVGIGTTSNLNDQFTVGTSTDGFTANVSGAVTTIRLGAHDTSAAAGRFDYDRATGLLTYKEGTYDSEGSALLAVTNSGQVGIGTSSPAGFLEINGGTGVATSGGTLIVRQDGDANTDGIALTSSNAISHRIWKDSSGRLNIGSSSYPSSLVQDVSGNLGIGTSSPQSILQVRGVNPDVYITSDNTGQSDIYFGGSTSPTKGRIQYSDNADLMAFWTNSNERMRIDSSGNVGIGTSSPSEKLQVQGSGTTRITVGNSTVNTTGQTTGIDFEPISNLTNSAKINVVNGLSPTTASAYTAGFQFVTEDYNGSSFSQKTAVTIGASGNVGIGTSSPSHPLHVYKSSAGTVAEFRSNDGTNNPRFSIYGDSSGTHLHHTWSSGASNLIFEVGGSAGSNEKMRIDGSGNVMVGTTNSTHHTGSSAQGITLSKTFHGLISASRSGAQPLILNRQTSDGIIAEFRKDGTTVGSIGAAGGGIYFGSGSSGTERMRITSGGSLHWSAQGATDIGRIGGTTYSSGERHVYIWAGNGSNYTQLSGRNVADGSPVFQAIVSSTVRAEIEANGDFLSATNSYGSTSDETLKENIVASGSQWDDIKAVQVKKFSYIEDDLDAPNMLGVIAQDLEASGMNGLVKTKTKTRPTEDGEEEVVLDDDGNPVTYKTVKYSVLYMKAIKALQEAMDKIEDLEARVATLEGN